jgi:hypothetical protein
VFVGKPKVTVTALPSSVGELTACTSGAPGTVTQIWPSKGEDRQPRPSQQPGGGGGGGLGGGGGGGEGGGGDGGGGEGGGGEGGGGEGGGGDGGLHRE